jgi:hypothetical protein
MRQNVSGILGGRFGAYKLSTHDKFSWKKTLSQTTKQPSNISAVTCWAFSVCQFTHHILYACGWSFSPTNQLSEARVYFCSTLDVGEKHQHRVKVEAGYNP